MSDKLKALETIDPENEEDVIEAAALTMEARIRMLLEIYPVISPTMLQAGLGPQIPPRDWRPALDRMLESGEITQDTSYRQSVAGRYRNYIRLSLSASGALVPNQPAQA